MKSILVSTALLMSLTSNASAAQIMECFGYNANRTRSVKLSGTVISNTVLSSFFVADYENGKLFSSKTVKSSIADKNYKPRLPQYRDMNRFAFGTDGWSDNSLLLPKVLPVFGKVRAVYQTTGHDSAPPVYLICEIGSFPN